MKKAIPLILFLIMFFPAISAIEINMNSEVPQGETIIASISGNFLDPITKSDISFYRGHVVTSFDYDVAKIGDNYYIYIQTTNKPENNYSINISGVRYYIGSQVSNAQISKQFKITNETADFSVDPGFIISHDNFSIKVQNLQPEPITINLYTKIDSGDSNGFFGFLFNNEETQESITLYSGQIKDLDIHLEDIFETTIRTITLSTENTEYNIPCYIILEGNSEENTTVEENTTTEDNTTTEENNTTDNETEEGCSFFGKLFNTCQNQTQENETPSNNSNTQENETNNSIPDYEVVKIRNKTVAVKDGVILNESATSKTCAQIKGKVCASGEICQNSTIYAKDAKCCISDCVKEKPNTNLKIIGWIIVGVLFIIILRFFVVRFRKMKRKSDPLLNPKK